jgi:FYVE zinc finger
MLTNYLWGTNSYWGGEDHHEAKNLTSIVRDEEEKDLEGTRQDMDELADRLLTQFPAYGTNSQHHAAAGKDDEDWLHDDDDDNDENGDKEESKQSHSPYHHHYLLNSLNSRISANKEDPTSSFTESSSRLFPGMMAMSLPSPSSHTNNTKASNTGSNNPARSSSDWDYDEQFLWKPLENGMQDKSNKGGHQHQKQQQQHQQQWMHGKNNYNHHPMLPPLQPDANNGTTTAPADENDINNNDNKPGYTRPHLIGNSNEHDFYNSRQHWMPDQLCKHCYLCDTPFTVFRRRHHCRLCGQVFCSSCSSFFVPSQKKGSSTLRACQMCYEQVTQKGGLLLSDGVTKEGAFADGSTTEANNSAASMADPANKTATTDHHRDETGRPVITDHKTLATSPLRRPKNKTDKDVNVPDRLLAAPLAETRDPQPNSQQQQHQQQQPQSSATAATAHWRAAIQHAGPDDQAQEAKRHLALTAANHLEKMGEALLKRDAPLLWKEMEAKHTEDRREMPLEKAKQQWLQKLTTLATRCCATVDPNVKKGTVFVCGYFWTNCFLLSQGTFSSLYNSLHS